MSTFYHCVKHFLLLQQIPVPFIDSQKWLNYLQWHKAVQRNLFWRDIKRDNLSFYNNYLQEKAECIIGQDYPAPMIDHDLAVAKNAKENCLKFFLVIIYELLKKCQLLIDNYLHYISTYLKKNLTWKIWTQKITNSAIFCLLGSFIDWTEKTELIV